MMTARETDVYRNKLHQMRADLDSRSSSLRDEACHTAGGDDAGDLSHAPIHLADVSNQEAEAAVNVELAVNEATLRQEIDDALERLDEGQYGICAECQREIDPNRLEAVPYSRLCIQCAERTQQQGRF